MRSAARYWEGGHAADKKNMKGQAKEKEVR